MTGPVQVLVVGYEQPAFTGEVLAELARLSQDFGDSAYGTYLRRLIADADRSRGETVSRDQALRLVS